MSYRIKTVAEITGIPRNTILAWERRYGLVSPARGTNGYRLYAEDDVATLARLKQLVDQGLKISEAVDIVRRDVRREGRHADAVEVQQHLLAALLEFDRGTAERLLRTLAHVSFEQTLDEVFMPMLSVVGDGWEAGSITVAQEHYVSTFCREHMIGMLANLGYGPPNGELVMCVGFPKEQHELGLLGAAIKLALRGLKVMYVGADLPISELGAVAARQQPSVVCTSIMRTDLQVDELLRDVRAMRSQLPDTTELVIGGRGIVDLLEVEIPGVFFCPRFEDMAERYQWSTKRGERVH